MGYSSVDEVLESLRSSVVEADAGDGTKSYSFNNKDANEIGARYADALKREESLKAERDSLTAKTRELTATVERLQGDNAEGLKATVERLKKELEESLATNAKQSAEIADWKSRDDRAKIVGALLEEAKKNRCVDLTREMNRFANEFEIKDGAILSKDGRTLEAAFKDELKFSPHWLAPSAPGGATGNVGGKPKNSGNDYYNGKNPEDMSSFDFCSALAKRTLESGGNRGN